MNFGLKLSLPLMRWNCLQDGPYTFHFSQNNDYVITVVSHKVITSMCVGEKDFPDCDTPSCVVKTWFLFLGSS